MKQRFYFCYCLCGKWQTTDRRETAKEAWRDMYNIAAQHTDLYFLPMTLMQEKYTPKQETGTAQ